MPRQQKQNIKINWRKTDFCWSAFTERMHKSLQGIDETIDLEFISTKRRFTSSDSEQYTAAFRRTNRYRTSFTGGLSQLMSAERLNRMTFQIPRTRTGWGTRLYITNLTKTWQKTGRRQLTKNWPTRRLLMGREDTPFRKTIQRSHHKNKKFSDTSPPVQSDRK